MNEAMRDWVTNIDDTFYIIGTVAGPHPYPMLVRDFQSVIGREARAQCLAQNGKLPDALVACVGGGSNAIGLFHPFLGDAEVAMYGVEAGGKGLDTGAHAAPLSAGTPGVLHGNRTYLMQDEDGQILETHSVSAGSITLVWGQSIHGSKILAGSSTSQQTMTRHERIPSTDQGRRHHACAGDCPCTRACRKVGG